MRFTLIFASLFANFILFAQSPTDAIDSLSRNYPQEKVVLTLSQKQYVAGETIVFKAYVLTGYGPSAISTNLYTELYDKQKKLLDKSIVPLFNGSGEGSFSLPASIPEDVYFIRAYTRYMLNYDEGFQYVQPIAVYNPSSINKLQLKTPQWTATISPEGGQLLTDQPTKIGVRLKSKTLLPKTWQGNLFEKESGVLITAVDVLNNEIGTLNFVPKAATGYVIKIKDNAGNTQEVAVPISVDEGTALNLSVVSGKVAYLITTKNIPSKGSGYKLVATLYDRAMFSAEIKSSTGEITGVINTKDWPSGVVRFTLFNEKQMPVNERLCFINQQVKTTEPAFTYDTLALEPKGWNHWKMAADSALSSYSIQVRDAGYLLDNNFLSQVYLTSDFLAPIQNASGYFEEVTDKKREALDALLITEKWSRFDWMEVLKMRHPVLTYQPDNYLTYTALVRKGARLQPLKDVTLIVQSKDSSSQFLQVKTDSTGGFAIREAIFVDTVKIFYQAGTRKLLEKDINIDFELQNKFAPYTGNLPATPFETVARLAGDTIPDPVKRALARISNEKLFMEKGKLLEEVLVKTKSKSAKSELDKKYSSPLFSSFNATVFDFVNEPPAAALGYTNILQWLRGRVSGLNIVTRNGITEVTLRGRSSLLGSSAAQIYVDEMAVDADYLNGFPVSNIALIKVIKGASLSSNSNGAIAIYTKRGGENTPMQNNLPSSKIAGYKLPLSFFIPDYSQSYFNANPDERENLFIATNFVTEENKPDYSIRFYNNDKAKKYQLIITGFTMDGQPVYINKVIAQK